MSEPDTDAEMKGQGETGCLDGGEMAALPQLIMAIQKQTHPQFHTLRVCLINLTAPLGLRSHLES